MAPRRSSSGRPYRPGGRGAAVSRFAAPPRGMLASARNAPGSGGVRPPATPMPQASVPALVLALAVALGGAGCAREYLPNTDVEDNEFNRKIVEFCEDYRHAVERKNVGLLIKLAHEKYYEDGATIDTSDDLDLAGLK